MEALYGQHTVETGQVFTPEALEVAWEYSTGQPWVVNALGYEVCFDIEKGKNRSTPISPEMIYQAKENLILRRETHLDQLMDKLQENRVRRVIGPMLEGRLLTQSFQRDDVGYVVDLGLIRQERNGEIRLANRLYQEIIPRELVWDIQSGMTEQTLWYVQRDGTLDLKKLLSSFQEFFREHSEHWIERFDYKEAGPQLLLQAFLQRIVNSGGRIEREYGLGRMRTDLLVIWPSKEQRAEESEQPTDDGGRLSTAIRHPVKTQRMVIELKILYKSLDKTVEQGLMQTREYMDRCRTDEGHLVIFDRSPQKSREEKIFVQEKNYHEQVITVWGM
ncbi:MAG: hypothetical protein HY881_21295 [Deltaproteobacteria bacterium]|nr:hypothetical protein [Deltaproteobacteria bacterium]